LAYAFMKNLAARVCEEYNVPQGSAVIEVGSGDGAQLICFKELGMKTYGFEPSEVLCKVSESREIPVYHGLYTSETASQIPQEYLPADIILTTYTFDHIPDPMSFLDSVKRVINPKTGLLIIEVHDLEKILNRREYCLFAHEHTTYLSVETMQRVLKRAGFELISTDILSESERRGNSLLVIATPLGSNYSHKAIQIPEETYIDKWETYEKFNKDMLEGIARLDDFVESSIAKGKKVAGFGGSGRGLMTLAAMKSASKFSYLFDNNPNFYGYVTPKSHIPIASPQVLAEDPVDVLVVFCYGYINEIKEQIASISSKPVEIISLLDIL